MTTPAVPTFSRQGVRYYRHPTTGEVAPGVTSVVGMLPKPFLAPWAAKVTAQAAVDDFGIVAAFLQAGKPEDAVSHLKRAQYKNRDEAGDIGTVIHELVEARMSGERPKVHPQYAPFMRGVDEFLDQYQPEVLHLERTVWSRTSVYSGTFDWILKIGDEVVLGDTKTTRSGVHADVALQLSAYRYADGMVMMEEDELEPLPEIEATAVLWLRPDEWKLVPIKAEAEAYQTFLALRNAVFPWEKEIKDTVVGRPLAGRVYGEDD